jgi:hypothetical protein
MAATARLEFASWSGEMKKFAQVLNNRLHWKFEQSLQPEFAPEILIVEITGLVPEPQEGWGWDGKQFLAPPTPSVEETFALLKDVAIQSIDAFHADTVQRLVGNPTQVEKDTWALKLEVANAIHGSWAVSPAGEAFLAGAGLTTATTKSKWANAVLAKSAAYAQVVGLAEKLRDTARTAIKAATDEQSLNSALEAQRAAADAAVASLLNGS